ncbi:MAG TPA: ACP S-malonyltransferase [Longimicrobiaceae bacterium]|nr:ACP S-malonyltransferase [Longimicrobiaceae bacterium]
MEERIGLLFPGQGSQAVGMGRELAERYPEAREAFEEADDALGFALSRLCWEGPDEELRRTRNAQPALLVHSAAAWRVLQRHGVEPVAAAGHSLGEFSAYLAAGSLAFADAVRTVRRRGELMYEAGQARPGTMAAVLGLDDDVVEGVCREASSGGSEVAAANFNAPGQVVVSGDVDAVERASALLVSAGAKKVSGLSVSGAFHSPLMAPAEEGLSAHLQGVEFGAPAFPVVSNVTAAPVTDPAEAKILLVRQLTSTVRWTDSVRTLLQLGATRFLEVGPGKVLTGMLKRIDRAAEGRGVPLGTPEAIEAYLQQRG